MGHDTCGGRHTTSYVWVWLAVGGLPDGMERCTYWRVGARHPSMGYQMAWLGSTYGGRYHLPVALQYTSHSGDALVCGYR